MKLLGIRSTMILVTFMRLPEGYRTVPQMQQQMKFHFGVDLSVGASYTTIHRMVKQGYLSLDEKSSARGRDAQQYSITRNAEILVNYTMEELKKLSSLYLPYTHSQLQR